MWQDYISENEILCHEGCLRAIDMKPKLSQTKLSPQMVILHLPKELHLLPHILFFSTSYCQLHNIRNSKDAGFSLSGT